MKITIEILDNCYGDDLDEDDNLIINPPPVGDRKKREKLLDRSFDEWEYFRSEMASVVVDTLLEMTPGYAHPEMHKAEERHKSMCTKHLDKCLDLWSSLNKLNNLQVNVELEYYQLVVLLVDLDCDLR